MTDAPRHAVIIPHYNDAARLARCLDALAGQGREDTEIVVVDNGSTEDLSAIRAAHPGVHFAHQPKKGAAAARNRGVEVTTAPAIAFLDADCVPAADWLSQVARVAAGQGDAITGGRVDVFDETPPPRSGPQAFETVFAFDQRDYVERKRFSVTANLVTTRAVFEATGPFVVGLSEDLDWCHRAVAKGYPIAYDDALAVAHPTRTDWPALVRKWRRMTEEGFATARGRRGGRAVWAARALAMPASVVVHAPRVLGHGTLAPRERRRGLVTLARIRFARMGWMLRQAVAGRP